MHAIITIGPDGTLGVSGPYGSGELAGKHARRLMAAFPGLNAEPQEMTPPRRLALELREAER
jgi:hypothetical protein